MLKNRIYSIIASVWLVSVTILSLMSFQQEMVAKSRFPWVREIIQMVSNISNIDKVVHFVFYFVLGGLVLQALRKEVFSRNTFTKNAIITLLMCVSIGVMIEFLQAYATSERNGDVKDALANTLGTVVVILLTYVVLHIKKRKKFVF